VLCSAVLCCAERRWVGAWRLEGTGQGGLTLGAVHNQEDRVALFRVAGALLEGCDARRLGACAALDGRDMAGGLLAADKSNDKSFLRTRFPYLPSTAIAHGPAALQPLPRRSWAKGSSRGGGGGGEGGGGEGVGWFREGLAAPNGSDRTFCDDQSIRWPNQRGAGGGTTLTRPRPRLSGHGGACCSKGGGALAPRSHHAAARCTSQPGSPRRWLSAKHCGGRPAAG
jgi:hypothetical protein